MIRIVQVNWLSKAAQEAEVILSDGAFSIICFSHPFNYIIGETVSMPLYAFNANCIKKISKREANVIKEKESHFMYFLSARVMNKDGNIVKLGEFIIDLVESLPGDVAEDDYVSFYCDRIDLY